ncbi:TraR/DksA family transcriptional regulator [Streptomyces hoynatensis]|uniref:TraR/DksA family transcriptional regulator n=1 Tax=Streptomyces hoynatensis TaxID=1141874 RepID=A0A3A9YUH7_9ACTN|nr:TraR/DksA family transcriptional regulator [Streptomyces hoynatensis]RKN39184.1 TraR/DksA family transcriptional regulator [Streptomyces hoynatensis]
MTDPVAPGEQQLPAWSHTVGPGWAALLARLHEQLLALAPDYRIESCRRALGGLRIWVAERFDEQGEFDGHWMDAASRLTEEAEARSGRTCELCGAEGRPRFRGGRHGAWITALCDTCAADPRTHAPPVRVHAHG